MIARRLTETLLFLESSSRTDVDREYLEAIRRLIAEHAMMREALERIRDVSDSPFAGEVARTTLDECVRVGDIVSERAILRALETISTALPTEEQLRALHSVGELVRSIGGAGVDR